MKNGLWSWLAIVVFVVYVSSMFLAPAIKYQNWVEVQNVLERWQALNVGVLAFGASILLWFSTKYRVKTEDNREYKVARVMLVFSANDLHEYIMKTVQDIIGGKTNCLSIDGLMANFEKYIKYAPDENSKFIIETLCVLQVANARNKGRNRINGEYDLDLIGIYCHLAARNSRVFPYARGDAFDTSNITAAEISNACHGFELMRHPKLSKLIDEKFYTRHAGSPLFTEETRQLFEEI